MFSCHLFIYMNIYIVTLKVLKKSSQVDTCAIFVLANLQQYLSGECFSHYLAVGFVFIIRLFVSHEFLLSAFDLMFCAILYISLIFIRFGLFNFIKIDTLILCVNQVQIYFGVWFSQYFAFRNLILLYIF